MKVGIAIVNGITESIEMSIEDINKAKEKYIRDEYEDGTETHYGPSNAWDAPGMCVNDFI